MLWAHHLHATHPKLARSILLAVTVARSVSITTNIFQATGPVITRH